MRGTRVRIGRSVTMLVAVALAAGSALTLASGPAASAATTGSIVYLKNGFVWIAHSDGTGARQFTVHKFNWASPSEANGGTIVVAGGLKSTNSGGITAEPGSEIYRFRANGNQIGGFIPTAGTYSSIACPTIPPTSVEVSPDAKKIAYATMNCSSHEYTTMWTPSTSTNLNFPNQTLGQIDFYEPHWITSQTFLVSHAGPTVADTQSWWFIHGLSLGDDVNVTGKAWNWAAITGTGAQGIIDRTGDKLVAFEDDAGDWLDLRPRNVKMYVFTGVHTPDNWTYQCTITLPAAQIPSPLKLHPSFSPDGTAIIWGDSKGIEEASLATPSNCASITPHLLIAGGSQPYWSAGTEQPGVASPHQPG